MLHRLWAQKCFAFQVATPHSTSKLTILAFLSPSFICQWQMSGEKRVIGPVLEASCDLSTFVGKAVPVSSLMVRMLLGHGLHRQRLGPWLYVPFKTDFGAGQVLQTSGKADHTDVCSAAPWVAHMLLARLAIFVFNLLVWPLPLLLMLLIVGSWHHLQGAGQNVETEIG